MRCRPRFVPFAKLMVDISGSYTTDGNGPGCSLRLRGAAGFRQASPSSIPMETRSILGLKVALATYQTAVAAIFRMAREQGRTWAVEAANTMVITKARHEPEFGAVIQRFDLILPDGMPLVWSLNRQLPPERKLTDRVYGPDLMLATFDASQGAPDLRHFLLGGTPEVLAQLQNNLRSRYPGAVIAGSYSPPFGDWSAEENERIFAMVRESRANLIWIGLGCPKQENWIAAHKEQLPSGVYFGIGAAFAFHAGKVKQAPAFLQKIGMEWAFRLLSEPRRLFKRYFKYNSLFLWYSLIDRG